MIRDPPCPPPLGIMPMTMLIVNSRAFTTKSDIWAYVIVDIISIANANVNVNVNVNADADSDADANANANCWC